jgi:CubicO group peptidase (beta-lactamase class C family)
VRTGSLALLGLLAVGVACSTPAAPTHDAATISASGAPRPSADLEVATPASVGLDSRQLLALTAWIRASDAPVFSVLVSRDGRLVYELYTGGIDRGDAHYLMSVTKSVLSALVGIAVDKKALPPPEAELTDILPPALFGSEDNRARFRGVTLRDVMGMSALDAQTPPHAKTPEALARGKAFNHADNRAAFALTQPILERHGAAFQYNDVTPPLAAAALAHATKKAPFEFAEEVLFGPLHFENEEWMHQDASGLDNGGYGLRLRPVDMQKLGILYLQGGTFRGARLLSQAWVDRSFSPYESSPHMHGSGTLDYGWFWWQRRYAGWTAHAAVGWKGQRIAIFREQRLVVTMTGCFEDDKDERFFAEMITRFVKPAVDGGVAGAADASADAALARAIAEAAHDRSRVTEGIEQRMVPSTAPKEHCKPLRW